MVLTPETLWSRRRMTILYGSPSSAAVPVATVRARTPSAPSGDYAAFVVSRWGKYLSGVEVLNEPNSGNFFQVYQQSTQ